MLLHNCNAVGPVQARPSVPRDLQGPGWDFVHCGDEKAAGGEDEGKGRVQKFLLSKSVDWSIKFYSTYPLAISGLVDY